MHEKTVFLGALAWLFAAADAGYYSYSNYGYNNNYNSYSVTYTGVALG